VFGLTSTKLSFIETKNDIIKEISYLDIGEVINILYKIGVMRKETKYEKKC